MTASGNVITFDYELVVCTRRCIGKKSKGDKGKDIVVSLPWQHIRFSYFHAVTIPPFYGKVLSQHSFTINVHCFMASPGKPPPWEAFLNPVYNKFLSTACFAVGRNNLFLASIRYSGRSCGRSSERYK